MEDLMDFLTSKEIIVVYIVTGLACLLCLIIYIIDKNHYKRKRRQNTKELNKLVEEVSEKIDNDKKEQIEKEEIPSPSPVIKPSPAELLEQTQAINKIETKEKERLLVQEEMDLMDLEELEPSVQEAYIPKDEIKVENLILENMPEESLEEEEESTEKVASPISAITLEKSISEAIPPLIQPVAITYSEEEPIKKKEKIEEPPIKIDENIPDEQPKEDLVYTNIEPDKEQAQQELLRLTQELEKAEQEAKNIDLTSYEEEQEENAIISIEELVKKSKEIYAANEMTQYADEGNEPISLKDLESRMKKVIEQPIVEEPVIIKNLVPRRSNRTAEYTQEKLVLNDLNTITNKKEEKPKKKIPVYQTTSKFKSSPVISPIYGIEKQDKKTDIELENTANYEKLDEEIRKTNEFLMTLKELQKYLD